MFRFIDASYINRLRGSHFKRYLLNGERGVSCRIIKLTIYFVLILLLLVFMVGINDHSAQAAPMLKIVEGDTWRYFKGPAKPPFKWNSIDFDDSTWPNGFTSLGYGSSNRTRLDDMQGNYSTIYSRKHFTINNIYSITGMTFSITCDGPFITYLNGIEVIRNDSAPKSTSDQNTEAPQAEQLDIGGFIQELLPGKNVISVECNNDDINSTDFSFVPFLEILEDQGGPKQ
jgi:hypothetical protein